MNRKSLGKCLQIAGIITVVCAPIPNLYIICVTLKPDLIDQISLSNYHVFPEQFLRLIPFLVVAGVTLFLTGRKLKRGQQMKQQ
jgi:uncharacterized membrane protein